MKFKALLFLLGLFLAPVAKAQQWSWVESQIVAGGFTVSSATWFAGSWYCGANQGEYRFDTLDSQWKLEDPAWSYPRLASTPLALELHNADGIGLAYFRPAGSSAWKPSTIQQARTCRIGTQLFSISQYSAQLYQSLDSGRSWKLKTTGLTAIAPLNRLYLNDIATRGSKLYVASNLGLLVSSDNGDSWSTIDTTWKQVQRVVATGTAVCAESFVFDEWVLHVTTDGIHWTNRALPVGEFRDLVTSENTIYVDVGATYSSTDDGASWTLVNLPLGNNIALHDRSILNVGTSIKLSNDAGAHWQDMIRGFRDLSFYDPNFEFASLRDTVIVLGRTNSFLSVDRKLWTGTTAAHLRQPVNLHDTLFAISTWGLSYSPSVAQWFPSQDLFQSFNANTIATDGQYLYAGINNTGFASPLLVRTSPQVWQAVGTLDASSDSVSASATNIAMVCDTFYVVLGSQGGTRGLFRTIGLHGQWQRFDTGLPLDSIVEIVHTGSDVVALTRSSGIYQLTAGAVAWKSVANPSAESPDHLFAFGDTLFVASGSALQFRIHDTWTTIPGVPAGDSIVAMFKHHGTFVVNTGHSGIYNLYPAEGSGVREDLQSHVNLVPNPAANVLVVSGLPAGPCELRIVDAAGRVVEQASILSTGSPIHHSVSSLSGGIYSMQITSGDQRWSERFVVAR